MVFKNLEKRALGRWGRVNIDLPSWWHTTFVSPLPRSPLEGQFFFWDVSVQTASHRAVSNGLPPMLPFHDCLLSAWRRRSVCCHGRPCILHPHVIPKYSCLTPVLSCH